MSFRKDVDEMMKNVQVDYEMTNNIMNNTVRNSGKKYRGFRKKAIVMVTLATLCIGTMAVGVSGFSGAWNNIVQLIQHKGIEMDEAQAVNFSKKGYIDVADADKVTATNNGITVSLIQTISDKKSIYLYLKVKSEDKKLNNGMSFVGAKINIKGFGNIDGVAGDLNVTSDYEGVFEVRMDVLSEYKEKNLDIYYISYNLHECFKKGKMKCNVKVEDFLSLIANASYVVTDSFHATAFSINFNTPFMIIFPEKFSTRLASILEVTGLQDRIVEDYNDIKLADKTINFEHANKVLEDERKKASEYLDKALND